MTHTHTAGTLALHSVSLYVVCLLSSLQLCYRGSIWFFFSCLLEKNTLYGPGGMFHVTFSFLSEWINHILQFWFWCTGCMSVILQEKCQESDFQYHYARLGNYGNAYGHHQVGVCVYPDTLENENVFKQTCAFFLCCIKGGFHHFYRSVNKQCFTVCGNSFIISSVDLEAVINTKTKKTQWCHQGYFLRLAPNVL